MWAVFTRTDDARSAGRGAVALGLFQSAGRLLALGFLVSATRAVKPSEFGRYSTVAALLILVGFLSDLGTTAATTKLVSTGTDAGRLLAESLAACFLLGLGAWAVGETIVALSYPPVLTIDFALVGASLPLDACLTTIIGALDGSGAIARRAVVSFVRVGVAAVSATGLVLVTGSIRWAMAGLVVGPTIGLVTAVIFARRLRLWRGTVHLDPRRGWPLIIAALPFAAIGGLSVVNARIDILVISAVSTRAVTASYDVAVRILEAPLFVIGVLSGPMLYLFSRRFAARDPDGVQRAYDEIARLFFIVGLWMSVILTTLGLSIVTLVVGSPYHQAGHLVTIFGTQLWLMLVCGLQGIVIASLPRMRPAVLLLGVVNAVWIALEVSFIVVGGPTGGALSYPIGTAFTVAAFAIFIYKQTGVRTARLPPLGAVVAAGTAAIVALALRHTQVAVPLLAASAVYTVTLYVFGTVGRKEARELGQLIRGS